MSTKVDTQRLLGTCRTLRRNARLFLDNGQSAPGTLRLLGEVEERAIELGLEGEVEALRRDCPLIVDPAATPGRDQLALVGPDRLGSDQAQHTTTLGRLLGDDVVAATALAILPHVYSEQLPFEPPETVLDARGVARLALTAACRGVSSDAGPGGLGQIGAATG